MNHMPNESISTEVNDNLFVLLSLSPIVMLAILSAHLTVGLPISYHVTTRADEKSK
jgi:hypothetical protein